MHRTPDTSTRCLLLLPLLLGLVLVPAVAGAAGSADDGWHTRVDDALREARERGSFILVDLYADWCGWCKTLEKEVFTTDHFQTFARDFVLLRVDVEDGGEGSRLQFQYRVSSLPTMLIIDADEIQVGAVPGYAPVQRYVASLRTEIERYQASLQYFEQARTSRDPKVLEELARSFHRRGDGRRAVVLYERLIEGLGGSSPIMAQMQFLLADARRLAGNYAAAASAAQRAHTLATSQQNPALLEESELLVAQIAQDAGDCDQAQTSLRRFIETHPKSPRRRQAKQALGAIENGAVSCS